MFRNSLTAMLALSLIAVVALSTPALASEDQSNPNCGAQTTRPVTTERKGLMHLLRGLFRHDQSNDDYVNDEPTDQFPITG